MRQLGILPGEIAIICSIMAICSAPIRLAVGMIADKLRWHSGIFLLCCLVSGIFHFALLWVPPKILPTPELYRTECVGNDSGLALCHRHISSFNESDQSDFYVRARNESTDVPKVCTIRCCNTTVVIEDAVEFKNYTNNPAYGKYKTESEAEILRHCPLGRAYITSFNTSVMHRIFISDFTGEICNLYNFEDLNTDTSSEKHFAVCKHLSSCSVKCVSIFPLASSKVPEHTLIGDVEEFPAKFHMTFWTFFILFFVGQAAFAPILNIIDSLTYMYLGPELRPEYGKQRLWGTVAFGVFVVITGFIMDATSTNQDEKNFTYPFVSFVILMFVTGFSVCAYKGVSEPAVGTLLRNVCVLLRNIDIWFLIATLLAAGFFAGVHETYFFYFLSTLHSSQLIMGLSMAAACLAETVVLWFSGTIIKVLTHDVCLIIVFVVFGVRLIAYSFLYNPWWAIATESLHCFTFGLLYPTITSYASRLAPEGMQGTVQSLVGAIYFSLGKLLFFIYLNFYFYFLLNYDNNVHVLVLCPRTGPWHPNSSLFVILQCRTGNYNNK